MTTTTSIFDPNAAAALAGPDWLRARRVAAARRTGDLEVPSSEAEVWRYSPIDDIELDSFELAADPDRPELPAGAVAVVDGVTDRAGAVIVHNGRVVHVELAAPWRDRGVTLGAAADHDESAAWLGAVADAGGQPTSELFENLNDAFGRDPVVLHVPDGLVVDRPFVMVDWNDLDGAISFPRLVVSLGSDAEAVVVDHHGGDDVRALVVPVIELDVARAGRLRYLNVQERGSSTWQIASQLSRVGQEGSLLAAQAALGGGYARTRADCRLVGRGATGNLAAIYFGEGDQTLDFRTFQDHAAPDTTSNLLFKGAVAGHSRSVYTGLIRVRPEGRGTNAIQTNRTIKLSDHAWAESVPNLEIENNDVHCAHASAVGPIDEDQRFYLESRGVPPEVAERLLVAGFFDEVLDQLPVGQVVSALRGRISERLERRDDEATS